MQRKKKQFVTTTILQIYRLSDWTSSAMSSSSICDFMLSFASTKTMIKSHNTEATKKPLIIIKKNRNCIKNEWIIMKWAHRNRRAWPVVWVQRAYMRLYYTSLTLCSFYFDLFFHNAVNWSHSQCYLRSMHHRDLRFCYDCCFCGPFFSIEK